MLLKEQLGLPQPAPEQTLGEMLPEGLYDPKDKSEILNEYPREQFRDPRQPMQVEMADASGKVPLPARNTDRMPEAPLSQNPDNSAMPAAEQEPVFKYVKPDDSRYQDSGQILIADSVLQGALPWLQAATDVALGRAPAESFDQIRIEHEKRIEEMKAQDPKLVERIQNAMPFLTGLGLSIAKPASTVVGGALRGAAVGGAQGAVQGYTSGPPEEPSISSDRLGQAVGGAAQSAVLGGVGGALPPGVTKGSAAWSKMKDQTAKAQKRMASAAKAATTRQTKKDAQARKAKQEELAEAETIRDTQLTEKFRSYRQGPSDPSPTWRKNRDHFFASPEEIFKQQAERNPSLEDMSRMLNLPPSAIAQRLYGKTLPNASAGEKRLFQQLHEVDEAWQAVRRKGGHAPRMGETANDNYKPPTPEDQVGTFVTTQVKPADGVMTPVSEVYAHYAKTVDNPLPKAAFIKQLRQQGVQIQQVGGKMRMEGTINGATPGAKSGPGGSAGGDTKSAKAAPGRSGDGTTPISKLPKPRASRAKPRGNGSAGGAGIGSPKPNRFDRPDRD